MVIEGTCMWLYFLSQKSEVFTIFQQFKALAEKAERIKAEGI